MTILGKIDSRRSIFLCGLLVGSFIVYPNMINLHWDIRYWRSHNLFVQGGLMWLFRYIIFIFLCGVLLHANIYRFGETSFAKRAINSLTIAAGIYTLYVILSLISNVHADCFTGLLLFQFLLASIICTTIGHLYSLNIEGRKKEKEIEQLKIENLQNRYDALANQINPHFFFNSLNGLTALVRQGQTEKSLLYIAELSNVFRYILQSDKKGLVSLSEELDFVTSFSYLHEVRFGQNVKFTVAVAKDKKELILPVLSMLPILENVVKHNVIDSDHPMAVTITVSGENELTVANPIREKIDKPEISGIGLSNLSSRFELLIGKQVHVERRMGQFIVYLPLKEKV